MGRPALLCVWGEPLLRKSADGQEKTISVTAYAVPPPPKGGGLLQLTNRCIKAPPSGELASIASLRGFPRIAAPPVKMLPQAVRRLSGTTKLK